MSNPPIHVCQRPVQKNIAFQHLAYPASTYEVLIISGNSAQSNQHYNLPRAVRESITSLVMGTSRDAAEGISSLSQFKQ